jgi:hypothetical protein
MVARDSFMSPCSQYILFVIYILESKENETDIIYDFAVKMMFNYEVESKADFILKAMEKETVPARIPIYQIDDCWFIG